MTTQVSSALPLPLSHFDQNPLPMDENIEMEMDMDIDLGPAVLESASPLPATSQAQFTAGEPDIVGKAAQVLDTNTEPTISHKLHIRGVDDLSTNDIKSYVAEHVESASPSRIEWIDDTSANLVFDAPATAMTALSKLTLSSLNDFSSLPLLQLRTAQAFSKRPETHLQVRIAVLTDQKRPRAYEASKFYMMHPEYDPRERRRQERNGRDDHRNYKRHRYGNEEHKRRKTKDIKNGFDASMYDDDEAALAARRDRYTNRRSSQSTLSSEGAMANNGDVGPNAGRKRNPRRNGGSSHNIRDRSASPNRDSDQDRADSRQRRSRRDTPPPRYRSRDPHPFPLANNGKELFPSKSSSTIKSGPESRETVSMESKELFPNKKSAAFLKKELFPNKSSVSNHHRSDAFDAADETADLFASGLSVPFLDGSTDGAASQWSLADRITTPSASVFGRLKGTDPDPDPETLEDLENGGFNIRGAAKDKGFLIRGLAADEASGKAVKELFPNKAGEVTGKDLFAGRLRGRGGRSGRRNKAADMFY